MILLLLFPVVGQSANVDVEVLTPLTQLLYVYVDVIKLRYCI